MLTGGAGTPLPSLLMEALHLQSSVAGKGTAVIMQIAKADLCGNLFFLIQYLVPACLSGRYLLSSVT
jgi:hypothetical protein